MYGNGILLIVAGVVLLIINICIVVKFFQVSKNIEKLTELYVDGVVTIYDDKLKGFNYAQRYYKLPLEEISRARKIEDHDKFINKTNEKRSDVKEKNIEKKHYDGHYYNQYP